MEYLPLIGTVAFLLTDERTGTDLARLKAFRIGFLTNVLNPKATLFLLSLFNYEKIINRTLGGFLVFLGIKIVLTFY